MSVPLPTKSANLKVQKPFVVMNERGSVLWLFYTKNKSLLFQIPETKIPEQLLDHMANSPTGHKCYISATVLIPSGHHGQLSDIKTLPAEDW